MSRVIRSGPELQHPRAVPEKSVAIPTMALPPSPPPEAYKPAPFKRLVTTHETAPKTGTPQEGYHEMSGQTEWQQITPDAHFSLIYTTSEGKPEMSQNSDVANHEALLDSGKLSLTHAGEDGAGSVCRAVEFAPRKSTLAGNGTESQPYMHRTQSLDYGIVVKGQSEWLSGDDEILY